MFTGNYKYSIDSKSRISIPAKLRRNVNPDANNSFIITRGTEKCIYIYPMDVWKELYDTKIKELNSFNPDEALFKRMFLQEATEESFDSQSRLIMPKNLLEYAEIGSEQKDVLILGAGEKIEVWNPSVYDAYITASSLSYEEITQKVMG
jgi:MraZ protein